MILPSENQKITIYITDSFYWKCGSENIKTHINKTISEAFVPSRHYSIERFKFLNVPDIFIFKHPNKIKVFYSILTIKKRQCLRLFITQSLLLFVNSKNAKILKYFENDFYSKFFHQNISVCNTNYETTNSHLFLESVEAP